MTVNSNNKACVSGQTKQKSENTNGDDIVQQHQALVLVHPVTIPL